MSEAATVADRTDAVSPPIVRPNSIQPTVEAYSDLLTAFGWFNDTLFDGALSQPLITLARKPRMLGAFCPNRFKSQTGELCHEIILNPFYLRQKGDLDTLSTLVHEMAHQWREDFCPGGTPSNGYHDALWASRMEELGLIPSHTGTPGGRRVGPKVSHFIEAGGPFEQAAHRLFATGFSIRWADRVEPEAAEAGLRPSSHGASRRRVARKKPKDRVKFSCPKCRQNAWARPAALLKCTPCDAPLVPPEHETSNGDAP